MFLHHTCLHRLSLHILDALKHLRFLVFPKKTVSLKPLFFQKFKDKPAFRVKVERTDVVLKISRKSAYVVSVSIRFVMF